MPGPKMGPRPADFDEEVIRQSPTFIRWTQLERSQKLRYACREFVKDHGDDEERLMRRIMIARRNNIRDHETLKRARRQTRVSGTAPITATASATAPTATATVDTAAAAAAAATPPPPDETGRSSRRPPTVLGDNQVEKEMDVPAVEATRSYRAWLALAEGAEFVYNQKYIKGRDGHDWLLRKNIWRRMRYRRENKKMVEGLKVKGELDPLAQPGGDPSAPGHIVDHSLQLAADGGPGANAAATADHVKHDSADGNKNASTNGQNDANDAATHAAAAAAATGDHLTDQAAVDAAVAAAESFGKAAGLAMGVHNPLDEAEAQNAVLDAAARLAAATSGLDDEDMLKGEIEHSESV